MTTSPGARSRNKGNRAETALTAHLRNNGFPYAERRGGGFAGADVVGTPGITWESKDCVRLELAAWVDQAEQARAEAGNTYGPVIIKRRGRTNVDDWYAVLPVRQLLALLAEAGWASLDQDNDTAVYHAKVRALRDELAALEDGAA